jgi:hypothetical protein
MSASTNRSASAGRHRRPGRRSRIGAPSTTPYTFDAIGTAEADRPGDGPARPLRAAGAGVGLAIAGVALSAFAPAAASAAPGLTPQQQDKLVTVERGYRADVRADDELTPAEKDCMKEASWARQREGDTLVRTAEKRARQHADCRIDVPPSFVVPTVEPVETLLKDSARRNAEQALVINERLRDQWHINHMKSNPDYRGPIVDLEPNVDPTNPFK